MDTEYMQRITSAHNGTIKRIRSLTTSAKARREYGQTIFEGVHVCESYMAAVGGPLYCVVSDSALQNAEVAAIVSKLPQEDCLLIPDSLFASLSTVENGVGILFVVSMPEQATVPVLAQDALLLDGVQDPGNLGTLLRTAAAAGVTQVYLSQGSSSAWAPRVIRAAMGAHMALNIYEKVDVARLISEATVPVIATSLAAKRSVYEADLSTPTAWLFGAEGQGISTELLALVEQSAVIIPQEPGVESLNVAIAAAICLFEQRRQRISRL